MPASEHKERDIQPWLAKIGPFDALLIIPVTQLTPALRTLLEQAKSSALFFSRPYATHSWSTIASLRQAGHRIDVLASSNYAGLDPCLRIFRTNHHLNNSKVLVGAATPMVREETAAAYSAAFGTRLQFVTSKEFKKAFNATDQRLARAAAVMQVLKACEETITVAPFTAPNRLLLPTAFVTGYGDADRGCRSQIRTRVSDAEKWLQHHQAGLHRLIFYGDHTRALQRMGRTLGFEVVAEL